MQLLEFQAKELLRVAGAPVPTGSVIRTLEELDDLVSNFPLVVKSQVPVGGRGKLGGIRLVNDQQELETAVKDILQLEIKGFTPEVLLLEQALEIDRELYLSLRINRDLRRIEYLVSREGGVEIESHGESVKVVLASDKNRATNIAETLGVDGEQLSPLLEALERCFVDNDLLLLEINPFVITKNSQLICADAKVMVDDNARFRHPELPWSDEGSIKPLGGTIGVIANGAGMAMSTMDSIYAAGGRPANFLDIGGGTGEDVFIKNLREITELPGVTSIIINIFAGITRCDDIARGIIAAKREIPSLVPLYIRLEGTRRDEATELLREAHIELQPDLKACIGLALNEVGKLGSEEVRKQGVKNGTDDSDTPHKRVAQASELDTTSAIHLQPETALVREEKEEGRRKKEEIADTTSAVQNNSLSHPSAFIFQPSRVLVQGITGHHGAFHTKGMIDSGTRVVAGVTPGKGGETVHDIPVYNSVKEAVEKHAATTSVIFVPARFARNAMLEAIEAGVKLIVCITEGIPVHDMLVVREHATAAKVTIVGPNCPGLIVPDSHKLGIIAAHITSLGRTAIISRSGTLTYELADALTKKGIGQRIILGIGGDPVQGMNFVEALELAQNDPETSQIVMVGEIGGESEQMAADYVAQHVTKPVYGLVVGHSLPAGQTFGHAGAIVGSRGESAADKTTYLATKGIRMSATLDKLISMIE